MQPDDIIRQKEWHELSSEEKKALQELVADEQEYNLIRKMMMIADETALDVPTINPAIQRHLHQVVKPANRRWYYAAAATVLIAATTWFLLKDKKERDPIVIIEPLRNIVIKKDIVASKDSIILSETVKSPLPKTAITYKPLPKKIKFPDIRQNDPHPAIHPSYAAVSTLVKDDSTLMAFITEVY